jgi:hypothetical protein
MTALAITSITNFLLAAEVFILAGRMSRMPKVRFSAVSYFSGVLLLLGVAALLGGIDHGFFEPANMPRYLIQRSDWIVLGGVASCLLMTTAKQFFPLAVQRVVLFAAVVQFAADTAAVLLVDSFLVVILNCAPVTPLDRNGLCHLPSVAGVAFLYFGGVLLRTKQGCPRTAGWRCPDVTVPPDCRIE